MPMGSACALVASSTATTQPSLKLCCASAALLRVVALVAQVARGHLEVSTTREAVLWPALASPVEVSEGTPVGVALLAGALATRKASVHPAVTTPSKVEPAVGTRDQHGLVIRITGTCSVTLGDSSCQAVVIVALSGGGKHGRTDSSSISATSLMDLDGLRLGRPSTSSY